MSGPGNPAPSVDARTSESLPTAGFVPTRWVRTAEAESLGSALGGEAFNEGRGRGSPTTPGPPTMRPNSVSASRRRSHRPSLSTKRGVTGIIVDFRHVGVESHENVVRCRVMSWRRSSGWVPTGSQPAGYNGYPDCEVRWGASRADRFGSVRAAV